MTRPRSWENPTGDYRKRNRRDAGIEMVDYAAKDMVKNNSLFQVARIFPFILSAGFQVVPALSVGKLELHKAIRCAKFDGR